MASRRQWQTDLTQRDIKRLLLDLPSLDDPVKLDGALKYIGLSASNVFRSVQADLATKRADPWATCVPRLSAWQKVFARASSLWGFGCESGKHLG